MTRALISTLLLLLVTGCPGEPEERTLLFDQGHKQLFTIEKEGPLQLGGLAAALGESGLVVRSTTAPITAEHLEGAAALVISGPFRGYTPEEVAAVTAFVEGGGRVAILLHIAKPMWGLLGELGVEVANGVVRDPKQKLGDQEINFRVADLSQHPITGGLETFDLYGGWPLRPVGDHAKVIAWTSAGAWVDLNGDKRLGTGDAVQAFGVAVAGTRGKGAFVVFSDDAIFQNRFLRENNKKLAVKLGHFLAGDSL